VGTQRFRVDRSEQLKHGLWVADVELLPDDANVPVPNDLAFTRTTLQGVLPNFERQIEKNGGTPTDLPLREPYRWDDCGWLANRWCELLPLQPELKQRFMALDSPLLRLELVGDSLRQMGVVAPE